MGRQVTQVLCFTLGHTERMLGYVTEPAVVEHCHGMPYYHGLVSFALEQNHRLPEAEAAAMLALEASAPHPTNPLESVPPYPQPRVDMPPTLLGA